MKMLSVYHTKYRMPLQIKSDGQPHLQILRCNSKVVSGSYLLLVNKGLFQQNATNALLHGVFLGFSNSFLLWRWQLGWREQFLLANSTWTVDDNSHLWRLWGVWSCLCFDSRWVRHVLCCLRKWNLFWRLHVHSIVHFHLHVPVTHRWKSTHHNATVTLLNHANEWTSLPKGLKKWQ